METTLAGRVLTVTMTDVEHRNVLSSQMLTELTAVFDDADARDDVRVVVLTNTGTTFCAGASLSEKSSGVPDDGLRPRDLFGRFAKSPKPYVGRIAGHCVAGGMGLAAAMDISIAADDVRFGFTEVRVGVAPAIISVVCLPKLRPTDVRSAFLRGNRLTPRQAVAMGLISEAVGRHDLDAAVEATVGDLLAGGPLAIAASKDLLARIPSMTIDDGFDWAEQLSAELFTSEEGREGMAAFLDRRPASWTAERE